MRNSRLASASRPSGILLALAQLLPPSLPCPRHSAPPPTLALLGSPDPSLTRPAASRVCDLTGKKANNGYVVTFSHKRNKKLQQVNLQYKKVYWPEGQR